MCPPFLEWVGLGVFFLLFSCSQKKESNVQLSLDTKEDTRTIVSEESKMQLLGNTQGTTYKALYIDTLGRDFQLEIDSLLEDVDNSLSTYNPNSLVTKFNVKGNIEQTDYHLLRMLKESWEISQTTQKTFDPTVMPLIEYWGFGNEKIEQPELINESDVDSLLQLVSMNNISINQLLNNQSIELTNVNYKTHYKLSALKKGVKLNFNAIAQGYTVDAVAELLEENGIKNYMVEIGGEVRAKGKNFKNQYWMIGIDKPQQSDATNREIDAILTLNNKAVATSGNYRKFYVKDGVKYSHTISPITGFPVNHSLLSATVITDNCAKADAYATAFLVMGFEKTLQFLEGNSELDIEVYLVYSNEKGGFETFISKGLKNNIKPIKLERS